MAARQADGVAGARSIPLHRELAERGPGRTDHHAVLSPDPAAAGRQAAGAAGDAARRSAAAPGGLRRGRRRAVRRAVEYHTQHVRQQAARHVALGGLGRPGRSFRSWPTAGIEWIASDEEILARSTEGWVSRDAHGLVRNPEMLYRPWRVEENGRTAADDLSRSRAERPDRLSLSALRSRAGRRRLDRQARSDPAAPPTADGQPPHAGEHHSRRRKLLGVLSATAASIFCAACIAASCAHPQIAPVRVCDYLERHPATDKLGHLFAGSWISHNFGIWIGHPACNRAWDLLCRNADRAGRSDGRRRASRATELARAWEELYIAEGSDWFWWFDDQHSSGQDWLFDQLFRKHLQNVYTLLGEEPPRRAAAADRRRAPRGQPVHAADRTVEREDRRPRDLFRMAQRRACTSPRRRAAR